MEVVVAFTPELDVAAIYGISGLFYNCLAVAEGWEFFVWEGAESLGDAFILLTAARMAIEGENAFITELASEVSCEIFFAEALVARERRALPVFYAFSCSDGEAEQSSERDEQQDTTFHD